MPVRGICYIFRMAQEKYGAVWVSHSSMGDFLKCPRAYYLHHVYKDPKTGHKITVVNPALSLGQAVHATLEDLKELPVEERLRHDLLGDFEKAWENVSGKRGGFKNATEEVETKERGRQMVARVVKNPGPMAKKTVRLAPGKNNMPPNFYLSEDENIILCGLIDWLEYVPADDSLRVIDFKTGKHEESEESLQLPIYLLLLQALQRRAVSGAAYWYLEKDDAPVAVSLPRADEAKESVLAVARRVKEAREKKQYACPRGAEGCFVCKPYELIFAGKAECVGVGGYGQDLYLI